MALIVLGLVLAESLIRLTERSLSVDIRHIRDAVNTAAQLDQPGDSFDVLVLGNSSARAGIDADVLSRQLAAAGHPKARVFFFYPDGGNIGDWRWAWRRYFAPPHGQPDLVLICGSRSHFDDGRLEPISAASYFVSGADALSFMRTELSALESRLEFLAAKVSLSFASRHRVQRRLLDMVMPFNRKVLGDIADNAASKAQVEGRSRIVETSTRLAALLDDLKAAHTPVAVVALPAHGGYEVPESRAATVRQHGGQWIDLRNVPGILPGDYYDGAHLNHDGAIKLSTALGAELGKSITH